MFRAAVHTPARAQTGGGRLRGSGFLRVDPEAEFDAGAMRVELTGSDLDAAGLIRRYEAAAAELGVEVPPALLAAAMPAGAASVEATISGSLLTPAVDVKWAAGQAEASGTVRITRPAIDLSLRTPSMDVTARLDTVFPPIEQALAARTQEESMAAGEFTVAGADADVSLHNLDLLSIVQSDAAAPERAAAPDRLRLRLSGRTRFSARMEPPPQPEELPLGAGAPPRLFRGDLQLQGLRLNQLSLAPAMSGR